MIWPNLFNFRVLILDNYMNEEGVNNPNRYVFLLGGHDLEMEEIANILIANKIIYHDRGLEWGAKLSAYADLFDDTTHFVGVELTEDIPPPRHYTRIDHHNELGHLPSSIEQVAALLELELTREQQLIAANDRGYIPAMEQMGASRQEIEEIRRRDRKAQGVSEEDERLAEIAISNNLEKRGELTLVEALNQHFSPIADRLYPYGKLLVSYQDHFVYYGPGVDIIVKNFKYLIIDNKAFHGGGDTGFFGIPKETYGKEEAEKIKEAIIKIISTI